jgi:hypothetical protein
MEKEFIPYEQALALKELGFDEPCFAFYRNDRQNKKLEFTYIELAKNYNGINSKDLFFSKGEDLFLFTSCPTFSQSFRFFREKYSVHASPSKYDETQWWVQWGSWTSSVFETFEDAELAWLNKMLEIVKRK